MKAPTPTPNLLFRLSFIFPGLGRCCGTPTCIGILLFFGVQAAIFATT